MKAKKYVQYKPVTGGWRRLTWGQARDTVLGAYDRNPIKSKALEKMFDERLKGATMAEFLAERHEHEAWQRRLSSGAY